MRAHFNFNFRVIYQKLDKFQFTSSIGTDIGTVITEINIFETEYLIDLNLSRTSIVSRVILVTDL